MNMKTIFIFFALVLMSFSLWSEDEKQEARKTVKLSYQIPTKLNWKQDTGEESTPDMQVYELEDTEELRLASIQVENKDLWEKFVSLDKEKIFNEMAEGKKFVHKIVGITNWTADKNIQKKSESEIIFEIKGSFMEDSQKKYFSEKYYMTPHGFILMTLDWTEKSDSALAKKAQDDFSNISFKSEIL